MCPRYVADRVNLGLIPSSEPGWRTACLALRSQTGGILHIHGNVNTRKGCGENIIVDNHADSGENIIVDNHPDSDEKQIGAEHINSKSNGILVDGSHEEGFQSETNEARVDSDTKTCLSDEKARGIVKTLNEIDVTDMDDSNVTNEIRLDDDRDKSDFDKSLAETQELIASCTEGADQVNSPEKDILVAENKKLSFSNQESNHHFAEMEKLPDNCKILGNKDNAEEKRLVPEASACKSKWLPWALDVSGKMRNILKQVHKSEWETTILHIEYVKSYAPHVDHIVLDLKCNPLNQ